MRTILFKEKRADTGEWIEGNFIYDAIGQPRITTWSGNIENIGNSD